MTDQQQHDLNQATIQKLNAETSKLISETRYYPALIIAVPVMLLMLQLALKATT